MTWYSIAEVRKTVSDAVYDALLPGMTGLKRDRRVDDNGVDLVSSALLRTTFPDLLYARIYLACSETEDLENHRDDDGRGKYTLVRLDDATYLRIRTGEDEVISVSTRFRVPAA